MHGIHRVALASLHLILALVIGAPAAATDSAPPENSEHADLPDSGARGVPNDDPDAELVQGARTLKQQRPELFAGAEGVLVVEVLPEGQGAAVGLLPGDVLVAYGDTPLDSAAQLVAVAGETPRDRPVTLHWLRAGEAGQAGIYGGRMGVAIRDIAQSISPSLETRMQALLNTGEIAWHQARYPEALGQFQQGLVLAEAEDHAGGRAAFLTAMGVIHDNLGRYQEALSHHQQALAIHRELGNRRGEGIGLFNIGSVYRNLGRYQEALSHYQQALTIHREIGDRRGEGTGLGNIGVVYADLGRYQEALNHNEQALAIRREIGDRRGEGMDLTNTGTVYADLGRYQEALSHHQQALAIHREIGDRRGEGDDLGNIGNVYRNLGRHEEALSHYRRALAIKREMGDRRGDGNVLNNIGIVYDILGRYQEALSHFQQALAIRREIGDLRGEGMDLTNLGNVYRNLGRYQEALSHFQQALVIHREIGDHRGEGRDLSGIGLVAWNLGHYQEALSHFSRAVAIDREIGDRRGEGAGLSNIGNVYQNLHRYQEALSHYRQALAIHREIGDRSGEAADLVSLGVLHLTQGHTAEALGDYQQALALQAELEEPETLWNLWNNLRVLWSEQAQPGPAILAGKRAVNTIQGMRAASSGLEPTLQQSFLETKEQVYRALADLLITQDRPAEAQQVLDMLKESEFYDYIREDDAHDPRTTRADYNRVEVEWNRAFDATNRQLAELARSLAELTRIQTDARSEQEQADIERLGEQRDALSARIQGHLDDLIPRLDGIDPARQTELNARMADSPDNKRTLLAELSEGSGARTGLLQFILLPDRIRILLTTPDGWHTAVTEIQGDDLGRQIETLRRALTNPATEAKAPARALYDLLVAPLAEAIDAAGLHSLLVHLDGRLRYIPLAALHDGERWLAERWPLVYYTAASERRAALASTDWRVAGLGTTRAHPGFSALPAVRGEIEGIVRQDEDDPDGVLPGAVHLDQDFTQAALRQGAAGDYSILHIATHFDLKPGNDSQSSLLLGTGERLSLRDLRESEPKLDLRHLDLVTLSACNTAMGGEDAQGAEIEGMGTIVQRQGARGVLASLWPVADASTGRLMQTFYRLHRERPALTKAQALQQAQLRLMGRDLAKADRTARGLVLDGEIPTGPVQATGEGGADLIPGTYAHPYYWAPFILMGNWL